MDKTKFFIIQFANDIQYNEIPLFRGAVLKSTSGASVLFHNHTEQTFRYSYPLIQYKRIKGKAAIVCINQGSEDIGQFFAFSNFSLRIGTRTENMKIESIRSNQQLIQVWKNKFQYHLNRWLPLNDQNYTQYKQLESLAEKISFLERMLVGNILSFGKGADIRFDKGIECVITDIENSYWVFYKGIKMMAFDVSFSSNVSLPDYMGLGKGVSLGHGTIKQIKE